MISKIFVNLPVQDLDRSMAFFKAIGFSLGVVFQLCCTSLFKCLQIHSG
jgi:predicted lactoylglutathione lyase